MAYDPPQCVFVLAKDLQCPRGAQFKVLTQIPPYSDAYCCCEHLFMIIDRLLGKQQVPVSVCRVNTLEVW